MTMHTVINAFMLAAAAADPLADMFANGETGDYWRFDADNTDANALDDAIGTATGLVNGLQLTQATGSLKPLLKELRGKQCAMFDGSGDRLIHSFGSAISQPGTIIVSYDAPETPAFSNQIVTGSGLASRWQIAINSSKQLYVLANNTATELNTGFLDPHTGLLINTEFNGASSKVRVNGYEVITGDVGSLTTDQLTVGEQWDGGDSGSGTRYIHGVFFIDRILTSGEIAYIEDLMATDAGLDFDEVLSAASSLSSLFSGGEDGDMWLFHPDYCDALNITEVTGVVNGLILQDGDASHLPKLRFNNGRWAAYFDGNTDRLFYNFGSTIAQPGTIIVGLRSLDTATSVIVTGSASGSRWQISNDGSDNIIMFAGSTFDSTTNSPINNGTTELSSVITGIFNGASSAFRENGSAIATGNPGSQGTNQITLGALWDGTFAHTFHCCGLLFIDRALSGADLDDAEAAMATICNKSF